MELGGLSPAELINEADRRLEQLKSVRERDIAEAAGELLERLRDQTPDPPTAEANQYRQMGGFAVLPVAGVALGTPSFFENSIWGYVWRYFGFPDPHLFGFISVKDAVLIIVVLIVTILLYLLWRSWRKRNIDISKLPPGDNGVDRLALAFAGKPQYETQIFKCKGDYHECCASGESSKICLAIAIICFTKELIPFA